MATDSDTSSASSVRVFTLLISALKCLVTSRPILLGVSAQMYSVGVPASDSQSHLHSHHSLDSVAEMVATAASATVSNVEVIDVYRGGILADWYVPLLILLTIILLMPHTHI